jgi:hypothetical protein
MAVNLKTLDFSPLSEFLLGTGHNRADGRVRTRPPLGRTSILRWCPEGVLLIYAVSVTNAA